MHIHTYMHMDWRVLAHSCASRGIRIAHLGQVYKIFKTYQIYSCHCLKIENS